MLFGFLGSRNYLFGFLSFLFLCQRRQGKFVGALVGLLFCLAVAFLGLGKIVEVVASSFLFRVGLAQFFVGMSIN